MHQQTFSAAAAAPATSQVPVRAAPPVQPTRGPPAGYGQALEGEGPADGAAAISFLADDHERIALGLNDVVVHRLFAASLDLHAALALMGEHRATGKVQHAVKELDQAVRDIRTAIFGYLAADRLPR